jgi:glucose-6-phosphate 1-epimerase
MITASFSNSHQTVDFLNQKFGHQQIKFVQVAPGLIKAVLDFAEYATMEIHLQGAHLTRWVDIQGHDNIFNSATAIYQAGVPIRGGNPIIFPQFGPGEICQHGFARNSVWRVIGSEITAAAATISLELKSEDITANYREQWPHDFVLTVVISLGESLTTQIKVHNPNNYPLPFTLGFHTYLAVDNINTVEINGLSGLEYMDNLRNRAIFREEREFVTISEFIDCCYQAIPATISINDKSSGRTIVMNSKNCHDAFVWNPWIEASKKLSDLEPEAYQKFICVEPGNMKTAILLEPKQEFITVQEINRIN